MIRESIGSQRHSSPSATAAAAAIRFLDAEQLTTRGFVTQSSLSYRYSRTELNIFCTESIDPRYNVNLLIFTSL